MELFWKTLAAALVCLLLALALERQGKDFSLLLTLASCVMILIAALRFFQPVLEYLEQLAKLGDIQNDMLSILMKIFGIGAAGEMAASVCCDGGNSSLGKGLRLLSGGAILYLSIPIYTALTNLLIQILGDV